MSILSDNLLHYRNVMRLTQAQAAEKAGVTRVAYCRAEKGETFPGDDFLNHLAAAYDLPLVCFFEDIPLPRVAFLSCRCDTAWKRARRCETVRNVVRWARDYSFLETMLRDEERVHRRDRWQRLVARTSILRGDPVAMARAVRQFLWDKGGFTPESIPGVLSTIGVKVYVRSFVGDEADGFCFTDGDCGRVIAVNGKSDVSAAEKALAAAHELGHLLQGTADDDHGSKGHHDATEDAAIVFARELLLPVESFRAYWSSLRYLPLPDAVLKVMESFKASYTTVLKRAEAADDIRSVPGCYPRFCQEMKRRGYDDLRRLTPDFDFQSTDYLTLAYDAFDHSEITMSRLAELQGCSLAVVRALLVERNRHG